MTDEIRDGIEYRYNDDDTLDEVVGTAWIHIEQLDDGRWWMSLSPAPNDTSWYHTIEFHTNKGRLRGVIEAFVEND